MDAQNQFPSFDVEFQELDRFIFGLVEEYNDKRLNSWDDLDVAVKAFFTPDRMDNLEAKVPGWKKMASYSGGITLTHVTCVFLGLFMLPEFKALTPEQQQIAKWFVLFHDIDKIHLRGKRDAMHAFRSAAVAAQILPSLGFPISDEYHRQVETWTKLAISSFTEHEENPWPKPDNKKLPEILAGIDHLFRENSPASLITKIVLLHISLNVDPAYDAPSPLTDDETKKIISPTLFPLLKVMMLVDNEGWSMFEPEDRARQRRDTLDVFTKVELLINDKDA